MYNQTLIGQPNGSTALFHHNNSALVGAATASTTASSANGTNKKTTSKRKMPAQMAAANVGIRKQPYLTPINNNNNTMSQQQPNLLNGILPYQQQVKILKKYSIIFLNL